ncbi:MAG: ATP-binding cassette domain-containing protein [Clostridiales bacterium]|nr:ATP-binding cassette domain-containing protein [Clostridiales bacterium]
MIEVSNLTKSFRVSTREAGFKNAVRALIKRKYEYIQALSGISFRIADGEMVGYIGPNGAGKSTTIKIMCGILTPDSGECEICGRIPWKERTRHVRDIGVVFGQRSQLWWDVPVIDSFELLRDIYKVEHSAYRKTLDELTQLLNLNRLLKTPTRNLSLGQRMRCEIAASLIHSPKVLFLDEPTIGLDAVSKIAVREFIKERNRNSGTTVILTTHDMQDIEALTERILLIGRGRILLDGNMRELKQRFSRHKKIAVAYAGSLSSDMLSNCDGITVREEKMGRALIVLDSNLLTVSEVIEMLSKTVDIKDISVEGVTAEEMVVELYKAYRI